MQLEQAWHESFSPLRRTVRMLGLRFTRLKPRRRQIATQDRGNHWTGSGKIHKGTKCPHGKNKRAHTRMHMLVLCQCPQKHTNVLEVHTPALRRVGQQNLHLSPNLPSCFFFPPPKSAFYCHIIRSRKRQASNANKQLFFFFFTRKG